MDRRLSFAGLLMIAAGSMLLTWPRNAIGLPQIDDGGSVPCDIAIEFLEPRDWRCSNQEHERCTECRNVSDHMSELTLGCVGQAAPERQRLPPGAEISVCPGQQTPAPSPREGARAI